ncbi:hypothetical protein BDR22DRAFT_178717 [Usnea florida]
MMGHASGVPDLVSIIPQGLHRSSQNDVGDWGLHTDGQVFSVKGATMRVRRCPKPCSPPCVSYAKGGGTLCTEDRVLDPSSSATKDRKAYMKHEQSDAKLGTNDVRLDFQSTTLSSLICKAKPAREVGEEWKGE